MKTTKKRELNTFTRAYIEAALWSSDDDDGEPLDKRFEPKHIAKDSLQSMIRDCDAFRQQNQALLEEAAPYWTDEQAGHDFWFTRNGHGAGFWDRSGSAEDRESEGKIADLGERLTAACKLFNEVNLTVYRGKIYAL